MKMKELFSDYIRGFMLWSDFSGVATRRQFWIFMIVSWLIDIVMRFIDSHFNLFLIVNRQGSLSEPLQIGIFTFIYLSIVIVPMTSIVVRRLHDIDLSGWWAMLWLIPILGFFCIVGFGLVKSAPTSRWRNSSNVTKRAFVAK